FATTGISAIDYLIADPWTLPPGEEANFVERIWRLPETRLCYALHNENIAVGGLPALQNGFVTFGCCNHVTKLNDGVIGCWSEILARTPNSRLLLKSAPLAEQSLRQGISRGFADNGIPAERVIMEGVSPRRDYLSAYERIDIALDPFPYPGGATTAEALWMGVP